MIWVIDDQGYVTIEMILGSEHDIKGFTLPADALAALAKEHPDIIFLDYQMPGMNGLEVLDQLQSRGIDVPVVMCSSEPVESLRAEALRRGAIDYISKGSADYVEEITAAYNKFAR